MFETALNKITGDCTLDFSSKLVWEIPALKMVNLQDSISLKAVNGKCGSILLSN